METASRIRRAIEEIPLGEPFNSSDFLGFGTRVAVDHALSRFARTGFVSRVARGVFARSRPSRWVGEVLPGPEIVARLVAGRTGAKVQLSGAEAVAELQLTTQRPLAPIFETSGPARRFRMGALTVTLRHVTPRRLALAGRPAGTALAALWHLGRLGVTEGVIEQVRRRLPANEFQALRAAVTSQPAWMAAAFCRYERAGLHG